jgi:hypothetical protein
MYPTLENSNPEAVRRIQAIAANDPAFLVSLAGQFAELTKYNIYALSQDTIEALIEDSRGVSFPPLASIALDEMASTKLAQYITDEQLAASIADFETIEAVALVVALQLYFADERANPGRPVTLEAYLPFLPVEGIDQE